MGSRQMNRLDRCPDEMKTLTAQQKAFKQKNDKWMSVQTFAFSTVRAF
jgi:hypothetical protein